MMSEDAAVRCIVSVLRSKALVMHDEKRLQEELAVLFEENDVAFKREVNLGDGDIIDFMFDGGIGLEVKLKMPKRQIYRQIRRYCGHAQLSCIILYTATAMGLPEEIDGKSVYYISIGENWL